MRFIRIPKRAFELKLTPCAFRVLAHIALRGTCYQKREGIAEELGVTVRAIGKSIRALHEFELITKVDSPVKNPNRALQVIGGGSFIAMPYRAVELKNHLDFIVLGYICFLNNKEKKVTGSEIARVSTVGINTALLSIRSLQELKYIDENKKVC